MLPPMVLENVFVPPIVWSPDMYTPSVTVAALPEMLPPMVLENVFVPPIVWSPDMYTPLVTVAALPEMLPPIVLENVFVPPIVWSSARLTFEAKLATSVVLKLASSLSAVANSFRVSSVAGADPTRFATAVEIAALRSAI